MANVTISAPSIERIRFTIRGTAPLMIARFSKKAEIMNTQAQGTRPTRAKREPRNFGAEWLDAAYQDTTSGWYGVNAATFRSAAISACRLVNFKMTLAKLSIFVQADGMDDRDMVPLVRITSGEPQPSFMHVRNATGVIDIRSRPVWAPGWEMRPTIAFDSQQFTLTDITNLIARVGLQVGIGEGRPDSRESAGLGYGLFEIAGIEQVK